MWREAVWKNGRKKLTGRWYYCWAGDYFVVRLDPECSIRHKFLNSEFRVYDESPEFGRWKLVRDQAPS